MPRPRNAAAQPEPDPETPDGRDRDTAADPWDPPWLDEDERPRDDLGTVSLPLSRFSGLLHGTQAPVEQAEVRRVLDTSRDRPMAPAMSAGRLNADGTDPREDYGPRATAPSLAVSTFGHGHQRTTEPVEITL